MLENTFVSLSEADNKRLAAVRHDILETIKINLKDFGYRCAYRKELLKCTLGREISQSLVKPNPKTVNLGFFDPSMDPTFICGLNSSSKVHFNAFKNEFSKLDDLLGACWDLYRLEGNQRTHYVSGISFRVKDNMIIAQISTSIHYSPLHPLTYRTELSTL